MHRLTDDQQHKVLSLWARTHNTAQIARKLGLTKEYVDEFVATLVQDMHQEPI